MKRCPKCNTDYFDNMLEFCLEDGAKLISINETSTKLKSSQSNPIISETSNFPDDFETLDLRAATQTKQSPLTTLKTDTLKQRATQKGYKILEISPIIFSLMHNWWQWLYLNNQNFSSFTNFLISFEFLIWFFLLVIGIVIGLFSLKFCERKGFAYTSLIIFSINFLLFLVPKR